MIDPAKLILDAVNTLIGLVDSWRRARKEQREELAAYFGEVSACLKAVVDDLRQGGSAIGACGELGAYAEKIPNTGRDVLGRVQADALQEQLGRAFHIRGLPTQTPAQLDSLEAASGQLRGLANRVKVA
jgi:hypothetical protein